MRTQSLHARQGTRSGGTSARGGPLRTSSVSAYAQAQQHKKILAATQQLAELRKLCMLRLPDCHVSVC